MWLEPPKFQRKGRKKKKKKRPEKKKEKIKEERKKIREKKHELINLTKIVVNKIKKKKRKIFLSVEDLSLNPFSS